MTLIKTKRGTIIVCAILVSLAMLIAVTTGLGVASRGNLSTDASVLLVISSAMAFGAAFTFGHLKLRQHGIHHRLAYAGVGAVATLPSFAFAAGLQSLGAAAASGRLSVTLAVPIVIGAIAGFLYQRDAGYEQGEDNDDGIEISTEYFDGPLVVRTSPGAVVVAALAASSVMMIMTAGFVINTGGFAGGLRPTGPATLPQAILGAAITICPMVYIAHSILRAKGLYSMRAYIVSGMILPGLLTLLLLFAMGPVAFVILVQLGLPSVAGMTAYRKLAGLEPAPLHEAVEVKDRRTLVGKDHISRTTPAVVDVSRSGRVFGRAQRG